MKDKLHLTNEGLEGLKSFLLVFLCINIFTLEFFRDYSCKSGAVDSGAVNRNTPYSPRVCSMFNQIAQNVKFFMFFLSVKIMMSAS